jgi:small subunit ribosomal protein S21e
VFKHYYRGLSNFSRHKGMTTSTLKADLYTPRKCDATGAMIIAKDHASIQLNIAEVDAEGKAIPGKFTTFTLSGRVRRMGEADDSINRLATQKGILRSVWTATN